MAGISGNNSNYQRLLDCLFELPIITRKDVSDLLEISSPTAGTLLDTFCQLGILTDATPGKQRNKKYKFKEYIDIMDKGTE